jgi:diadenylate cyclase
MSDMLKSLYYRWTSQAYDVPAVLVELVLIGLCVNWCASVLHGTRGTRPLRGVLVILVGTTLVVRVLTAQFEWVRLDLLYSYILYGLAFIALVVFQPELRRAVIRFGEVRLRRSGGAQSQVIAALVKSAGYLSRNRYGALIAIQRSVDLTGWAENGTVIRATVSANLLNTIFYPGSALHDLGVIIRDTEVVAANCQFPSAESDEVDIALGSRHLAAVGMSYETDALVLVVSEETGVISLADNGSRPSPSPTAQRRRPTASKAASGDRRGGCCSSCRSPW